MTGHRGHCRSNAAASRQSSRHSLVVAMTAGLQRRPEHRIIDVQACWWAASAGHMRDHVREKQELGLGLRLGARLDAQAVHERVLSQGHLGGVAVLVHAQPLVPQRRERFLGARLAGNRFPVPPKKFGLHSKVVEPFRPKDGACGWCARSTTDLSYYCFGWLGTRVAGCT